MKKKILSLFLALAMCLSLLPTAAFAADGAQDPAEPGEEILAPEQLEDPEKDPDPEQEQEGGPAGVSAPQTGAANSEIAVQATGGHSQYHTEICNTYGCTKHQKLTWYAISTVDQLKSASGETKGYYLTTDLELTEPWTPTGTVNLCLSGHSITLSAGTEAAPQSVITVNSGVQLNISNCISLAPGGTYDGIYYGGPYIQHAKNAVGPGITVLDGGTVELFDGDVTQNSDGVVVENGGTLSVRGDISENTGAGVRLEEGGTLSIISGGRILLNNGCGVEVAAGSNFTVSGGAEVRNNTKGGETCNVYLRENATMTLSGLSSAKIGVTVEKLPDEGAFVPVTSDDNASRSDQNCITSDNASYRVFYSTSKSNGNLVLDARPTPLHADHNSETFVNSLSSSDGKLLINGEEAKINSDTGSTYYVLPEGNYYLEDDLTLSCGLLAYSTNVVLCLNGHNITVTGTSYVIYTAKKTSSGSYAFTLTDCADEPGTLTHLYNQYANGGVCVRDGTFIMRGGKISGNNSGVYVYQGNEFKIYGGEISGNKGYGVSLTPDSKSYIYMTVGGTAKIRDNWADGAYNAATGLYEQGTTGTAKNVLFTDKPFKYITVDSTLTEGAEIGVTIWKVVTAERDCVAVATCGTALSADASPYVKYFKSDSDAYKVWSSNNNVVIGVWNSDDQIHPVCGAVCNHKDASGKPVHNENIVWTPVSSATGLNNGDNIYLTDDITLTRTWQISAGGTVNLCLNGHTIKANGDFDAITLTSNTNTLNICDCSESGSGKITHGTKGDGTTYSGAGVYMTAVDGRKATVNMYGGTITGNTGHTVTVKNVDSTRGGGVYVDSNAQFFMRGGSITENTADVGGGVYYTASNSLFVSGKVNITGNKDTSGADSNVYVPSSSGTPKTVPFYIGDDGLDTAAEIGVRVNDGVIATGGHSPVAQFGTYANAASAYNDGNFHADNEGDYSFKVAEREQDTITSTHVVNLYNGLHEHPICGAEHKDINGHKGACGDVNWTPWDGVSDITYDSDTKTAYVYLTDNAARDSALTVADGYKLYLCLNGHSLTGTTSGPVITVGNIGKKGSGATLSLCDCKGGGEITHRASTSNKTGAGVSLGHKSTFDMYGGSITDNRSGTGGGVSMGSNQQYGNNKFNMYGGRITNNVADSNVNDGGGGVHNLFGTFTMYGGSITENHADKARNGGGGVYLARTGTFKMYGGSITNNTAQKGGGVYVDSTGLTVSGDVTISGNTDKDGNANNVYLMSNITIQIGGALGENASIGVTTGSTIVDESYLAIAMGGSTYTLKEGDLNAFTSDNNTYGKQILGNNVVFTNGELHEHAICGKTAEKCTDRHSDEVWTPLTSVSGKPYAGGTALETGNFNATEGYKVPAGRYYLSAELALDKPLLIKNGVYLCLNGQTLTVKSSNSAVIIDTGCDLTLCDCSEEQTGKITHANGATGCGVYMGASQIRADLYTGRFTMYGGSISGNKRESGGAGVYMYYGMFNMHGGSITGNTVTSSTNAGGGVYVQGGMFNMSGNAVISNNNAYGGGGVYVGSGGKFDMSGNAAITGNTASLNGGGVYVYSANDPATFTMSDNASVSGNNANGNGGGVYVAKGTATTNVSGDVQIKDNWKGGSLNSEGTAYVQGDGSANNVYLCGTDEKDQKTVTIGGDLTGAKIGITTSRTPTASSPVQIATGAQDGVDYTKIFTPDMTDYTVTKTDTTLYLSAHTHHWKYENSSSAAIKVTCDAPGCNLKSGFEVTYTLTAPAEDTLTYDGTGKPATVNPYSVEIPNGVTLPEPSAISYTQTEPTLQQLEATAVPTNAGTYTASITMGGVTASVTYAIAKAIPTADDFTFTPPTSLTYDGSPKTATVTSTKIDASYVKVKYYQSETEVSDPTNAGTYTVKIDVTESGNYFAASGLNANDWMFAIAKNTNTPDVTLSGEMVYKREKIEPTATVKIGNATLVKDQDYTVTYGTNFDAGTNTGVVYIEAKGNYGFTEVIKYFNIAKKTITVTAENKSSRVGQALEKLTYTCDPQPYESDTFSGELATNANKDTAGTYDITQDTLTLGDNYNIDFKPGTYTVNAKDEQTNFNFAGVENGKVTKVYGADTEFTLAATGAATGSTVTYESTDTNVATVDSNGKVTIKGAGTAKITATASATDDYAEATAQYTLTVSPKTLTAADLEFTANSTFTKEYDGTTNCTTATVQINSDAKVNSGDALPEVKGAYAYDSKDAKGATKVTFNSERTENTNYILPVGLKVENAASITKRVLTVGEVTTMSKQYDRYANATFYVTGIELIGTVSGETLKMDATGAPGDYGIFDTKFDSADAGKNKRITGTVTLLGSSALASNYTFEVDGKESSTAPFTATGEIIPADGGSKGSVEHTQKFTDGDPKTETIAWQQLLPAGQTWNYGSEYYSASSVTVDHGTDDNGALTYTITGGKEDDVVVFTVSAKCNNYQDFTYTVRVTLTARDPQKLEFKGVENGKVTKTYGDQPFTEPLTGAETTVTYTSSDENVAKVNAQTGEVTIVGAGTAEITAAAAETDVYASASASYTLTVNKLRIPVPTKGKNELEYTGHEQTYLPDGLDPIYCTIESNTATDVIAGGSWHNAEVRLTDRSNTEWADGADSTAHRPYPFRITPKPVTVTALDKKITAGLPAPELTSADYTVTGLIGNDTLGGISLYYADPSDLSKAVTPDTGKAGTYAIVITEGGTGNNNYAPTFVNGTLTIASRPSGGVVAVTYPVNVPGETERGSVSSNVKNASKGSTVTITVEPEDGFQLADLTVTDKDGNELPLTDKGDGKYTFTMPAGKVEVNATFAEKIETSPFADVSTDAYYYEAVKWAAEQGITGGVGGGLFAPDQSCTRAQIVTFLWRAAGSPEPKSMRSFSDVPEDSYYAKAVAWAVENGITVGTSATTFSPDATCTRAQGVTFLFRAAKASADGAPAFRDVAADAYYAAAVKWATDNSVTNGIGGGLFGSDNDCTRAQIVTFLWRLYAGK